MEYLATITLGLLVAFTVGVVVGLVISRSNAQRRRPRTTPLPPLDTSYRDLGSHIESVTTQGFRRVP